MSSTTEPFYDDDRNGPLIKEPDHDVPIDGDFTGPFFQKIGRRKLDQRDAKCLVTADDAQTGVGKSNLCDFLGYVFDTTEEGFSEQKIAIDPPQFFDLYGQVPKGSAIVLEEGEQLDSRRSMSHENVDASHTWAKERVREIIALINLPSPQMIDGRLELLSDYWINVERRGRAKIYEKKVNRIKRKVYYETVQILEWPNMDGSETFRTMEQLKLDHLNDDQEGTNWVRESEVKERVSKAREKAQREKRDDIIKKLSDEGFKNTEIAPAVDLSPQRVGQIAREN